MNEANDEIILGDKFMYVVIFKAVVAEVDELYIQTAQRMRQLALEKYNCADFISVTESQQEVSISYWHTQEDIIEWKKDAEHQVAQQIGQEKWYSSYSVEITEILRQYVSK